jgi:hypothetical protein
VFVKTSDVPPCRSVKRREEFILRGREVYEQRALVGTISFNACKPVSRKRSGESCGEARVYAESVHGEPESTGAIPRVTSKSPYQEVLHILIESSGAASKTGNRKQ